MWEERKLRREWLREKDEVNEKKKFSIGFGVRKLLIFLERVIFLELRV